MERTFKILDRSMRWQYDIILALMSSMNIPDCLVIRGIPSGGVSFLWDYEALAGLDSLWSEFFDAMFLILPTRSSSRR